MAITARRIVQLVAPAREVTAQSLGLGYTGTAKLEGAVLYGLCSDGTVWALLNNTHTEKARWVKLQAIPQDEPRQQRADAAPDRSPPVRDT